MHRREKSKSAGRPHFRVRIIASRRTILACHGKYAVCVEIVSNSTRIRGSFSPAPYSAHTQVRRV